MGMNSVVLEKIKSAPSVCGIYRFLGSDTKPLYIGKAVNLSSRLGSYIRGNLSVKIAVMVSLARDLDWTQCDSEADALLLEATQVRRWKPKYNTLLKDDKSFLQIVIEKREGFSRIYSRRERVSYGVQEYTAPAERSDSDDFVVFGPFASGGSIKTVIDVIQRAFLIRDCTSGVFNACSSQKRPCLQYHIKRCSAPCAGYISKVDYGINVAQAISFLRGNTSSVIDGLSKIMKTASDNMEFELAMSYRDRIRAVYDIISANSKHMNLNGDFINFVKGDSSVCLYITFIRNGINTGSIDIIAECSDNFSIADAVIQFYESREKPHEMILPSNVSKPIIKLLKKALSVICDKVKIRYPNTEMDKKIMFTGFQKANEVVSRVKGLVSNIDIAILEMCSIFSLSPPVSRIEVFDNSHLCGTNAVGAMIVYADGGFSKKDYRKFHFSCVDFDPADDYAMMKEMLTRRLVKIKQEIEISSLSVPDLWLIDGGSAHRSVVIGVMENVGLFIPFICISKGVDRNAGREQFWTAGCDIGHIEPQSRTLFFLQMIRDEAHRFAISSHRKKRDNAIGASILDNIPGIGPLKKKSLLLHFKSVDCIRRASVAELQRVNGITLRLAEDIYRFLGG